MKVSHEKWKRKTVKKRKKKQCFEREVAAIWNEREKRNSHGSQKEAERAGMSSFDSMSGYEKCES